jgi:hypothetical protein
MNATSVAAISSVAELETKPENQLGIWMASAIVVGSMIGAGNFLLPLTKKP